MDTGLAVVIVGGMGVVLAIACYHWGRFEGELIGRNAERCRDADEVAQ